VCLAAPPLFFVAPRDPTTPGAVKKRKSAERSHRGCSVSYRANGTVVCTTHPAHQERGECPLQMKATRVTWRGGFPDVNAAPTATKKRANARKATNTVPQNTPEAEHPSPARWMGHKSTNGSRARALRCWTPATCGRGFCLSFLCVFASLRFRRRRAVPVLRSAG